MYLDPEREAAWRASAARLLRAEVTAMEPIGGGRNSRVYRLRAADGPTAVLKAYFQHADDHRDRLGTEFTALSFLWDNGVRAIPRPQAMDREAGFALYEYVEGQKLSGTRLAVAEIDQAVDFLVALRELKDRPGSDALPPASEACFSVQALEASLRGRLNRLVGVPPISAPQAGLHRFLLESLVPGLDRLLTWGRARLAEAELSFEADLPRAERTLSPSDFGFHNALRRPDGQLVFLDFEYFGWDDPAKMVSDMLLHPAMNLAEVWKWRFARRLWLAWGTPPGLQRRVEVVYPLWGVKWCLILLNEFLPDHLQRRQFAGRASEVEVSQAVQLAKAEQLWQTLVSDYEHFSYFNESPAG